MTDTRSRNVSVPRKHRAFQLWDMVTGNMSNIICLFVVWFAGDDLEAQDAMERLLLERKQQRGGK